MVKALYDSEFEQELAKKNLEWQYRFPKMLRIIREQDPDVMVFQEMDHFRDFANY
jgi:endonuclease/exonuclease/phosphatase family metal-dependent hydrolase